MSIAIEIDNVSAVLLRDGWHEVLNKSFEIDAYEFIHHNDPESQDYEVRVGGGELDGISAKGAKWQNATDGTWIACPLNEIKALKYNYPRKKREHRY